MTSPRFPIFIPSKGRSAYMLTSKALTRMGVHHTVVVEPQEADDYKASIASMGLNATVATLDLQYKNTYNLCDNLGLSISTGSGPARNFIWQQAIDTGASHHWCMDDNIRYFERMTGHQKDHYRVDTGGIFAAMEDFTLRYRNVAMAGPNYKMFAFADKGLPPVRKNTRIYSCNLIRNDIPFRWRGRYNEDTILSLDVLKAGWCTLLFNAFLQEKVTTQRIAGGNTTELYADGTKAKSLMLKREHPDVTRVTWKYGRVHHQVNYRPFRKTALRTRTDRTAEKLEPNEYGMRIAELA